MTNRDQLIEELQADEGLQLRPYHDTEGQLTIGYGHNLTANGISALIARQLLADDVDAAIADLRHGFPWFGMSDPVRQRALANLRFNLGPARFRLFTTFLALMATHDYGGAAKDLMTTTWASQVQPSRRDRIVRMIETGRV
jgi:lysozyme